MAYRSLTDTYFLMRNNAIANRNAFSEQVNYTNSILNFIKINIILF